jgi:hypothetical protein
MSKPLPPRPDQPAGQKPAQQVPAAKPEKPKAPKKASPWPWGPWRRVFFSLLIVFHVTAVFSAPWFIQMQDILEPALPPGRVPRDAAGRVIPLEQLDIRQYPPIRPVVPVALASPDSRFPLIWHYANLLYINNGYDFFSPDPSVSHLIRYEVFDKAGQSIAKGELPNRQQQWPRLLYHRYMMLVDQSSDPRNAQSGWESRIADRLLEYHNGETIRLIKVRHHLLTQQEVLEGRRLNEDSTYEVLGQMDQRRKAKPVASTSEPRPPAAGGGQ